MILLLVRTVTGFGQVGVNLPEIHPSYITDYSGQNNLFANNCFENVVQDDLGRLWMSSCGNLTIINSLGLTYFDGYQYSPLSVKQKLSTFSRYQIAGLNLNGELYGAIEKSNRIFKLDTDELEMEEESIPCLPTEKLTIKNIVEYQPSKYYIISHDMESDSLILISKNEEEYSPMIKVAYPQGIKGMKWGTPLTIDNDEIWFMSTALPLLKYDITTGKLKTYTEDDFNRDLQPDFVINKLQTKPVLLSSKMKNLYLYLPDYYGNQFFVYQKSNDKFQSMSEQFPVEWTPAGLFQDKANNICFLFRDEGRNYRAILEDTLGRKYDYSPVFNGLQTINQIESKNFFDDLFVVGTEGLKHITVNSMAGIQNALTGEYISSMVEVDDSTLLVNTIGGGWKKLNTQSLIDIPFQGPKCGITSSAFDPGMKQQIHKDGQGNLWFFSNSEFISYNPRSNTCTSFSLGRKFNLFEYLNDSVAVLGSNFDLQMYNVKQKKFLPFQRGMNMKLPGRLRDLLLDQNGILWIPTNNGLLNYNPDDNVFTTVYGESHVRFTSICEMKDGKIWLGTYFQGIWIYDSETGHFNKIQNKDGLSNNAVMSLISDHDGYVWAGTEYGINVLSPEGEVLGELHIEDGLSYEVFERFDPYKDQNGRLYFGSINGINIFHPQVIRKNLLNKQKLNIYLTEVSYYNNGQDTTLYRGLTKLEKLSLPAQRRYLNLKFAISSYIDPSKNQYYYQLKGLDDEWRSLGSQRELNLNHLPAGDFTLLIRGENLKHHVSTLPIQLSIYAAEYFYREWWFYLVIFATLVIVALWWIRNLRRQKGMLESEVHRRTKQIRKDKETIEKQAQELQELDQLKTRFFNNISHELRTPLTLITAPVEKALVQPPKEGDNIRVLLQSIYQNSKRLLTQINGYLELSKLDVGISKAVNASVDFHQFMKIVIESFIPAAKSKNINIETHFETEESLVIDTDKEKLETIVVNILINAIKFSQAGGNIYVKVRVSDYNDEIRGAEDNMVNGILTIEVGDEGPGIEAEILPFIFDRYYQGGDQRHKGSGMGLAISKELTELLNGTISVQSNLGKGSTFLVSIPVQKRNTLAKSQQVMLVEPSLPKIIRSNGSTRIKKFLLIVEDDTEIQQLLKTILAEDYNLICAKHGKDAWDLMKDNPGESLKIDAIICDLMMPVMDGMTLLKKVKEDKYWKNCPIIVLSAKAEEEGKLEVLQLGIDDYLIKPFSPRELTIRIENMITNNESRQNFQNSVKGMVFEDLEMEEEAWLQNIQNIILNALKKNIECTVQYVSQQINLSERQLNRRLKSLSGLSPNQYIREVKLLNARHLLEHKSLGTVAEVAYASGFNSPSYFSKIYYDRFGQKPGGYF
ncbi:response regulator [Membranihabitans marinus]|uniref:response regulator n=1 Tax=Membranihabitans marinus TaxID=1227546 RepID=UPI001F010CE2|nr:response regulator [Membranihabitans marinus]